MISMRNARRLGGATALLIGSALATVVPVGAAHAAVPGLITVQTKSVSNSVGKITPPANCPPNTRLVDAGGYITGPAGIFKSVVLDDFAPQGLNGVLAEAYEADPTAADWRVHAVAVCASKLPGQVLKFVKSPNDSSDKSVTVDCPTGTNVIGVGSQTDGGLGDVIVDRVSPNAGLTSVTVDAKEDGKLTRNWDIIAYAICAKPLPGLVGIATSPPADSNNKTQRATCPTGSVAIGGGGQASGAGDQVSLDRVLPRGNSVVAGTNEEDPTARNWTEVTTAICAQK